MNTVSIILPFFNEEKSIPVIFEKLKLIFEKNSNYNFELVFVDNASEDQSSSEVNKILEFTKEKSNIMIKLISFTRNFGYQSSLLAGYEHSTGDAIVVLDTDLEDPPELINDFIKYWKEGYKIVYGKRIDRDINHNFLYNFIFKKLINIFYFILRKTSDFKIYDKMAEFALISKEVKDQILKKNKSYNFFRAEIGYSGYSSKSIDYKRNLRMFGKSNYNFFGAFRFAIMGLLTTSTVILRFPIYFLSVLIPLNLISMFYSEIKNVVIHINVLFILIFFSISILYIARIYQILLNRPPYVINIEKSIL